MQGSALSDALLPPGGAPIVVMLSAPVAPPQPAAAAARPTLTSITANPPIDVDDDVLGLGLYWCMKYTCYRSRILLSKTC